jgi:hypothetical protein
MPQLSDLSICPNPIFIIGSPRSGTSILAWSLAQHSRLWTSEESDILFTLFGNSHAEKAFETATGRPGKTWMPHHGVDRAEFLGYLGLGLNALFSSRSEGKRWIDQTPLYTLMVDTLVEMFPGAQFLHIVRDGRKVVHSMTNFCGLLSEDLRAQFIKTKRLPAWATDFHQACKTWRRFVEVSMDFCARHPDRCLTVRNEDLVAGTEERFGEMFRFLGVAYEPDPVAYFQSHRINTSFPHLEPDRPPALQKRPDPWQQWTTEQKRIFTEEAGETLLKYGLASEEEFRIAEGNGHVDSSRVYLQLVRRVREVVQRTVPAEAHVIVVSKGDQELLDLSGRGAWHFPQTEQREYAGHYPPDSRAAIEHLEALRTKGGEFLLFPSTAFWWLEFYADFREHLDTRYRRVWGDEHCIIYQLSQPNCGVGS